MTEEKKSIFQIMKEKKEAEEKAKEEKEPRKEIKRIPAIKGKIKVRAKYGRKGEWYVYDEVKDRVIKKRGRWYWKEGMEPEEIKKKLKKEEPKPEIKLEEEASDKKILKKPEPLIEMKKPETPEIESFDTNFLIYVLAGIVLVILVLQVLKKSGTPTPPASTIQPKYREFDIGQGRIIRIPVD